MLVCASLARGLDHDAPGVSASILEGLDEMLTVTRLGLPDQLRRALGCTNAIESLIAFLRQVCRDVKLSHQQAVLADQAIARKSLAA
jgi:putative transposase